MAYEGKVVHGQNRARPEDRWQDEIGRMEDVHPPGEQLYGYRHAHTLPHHCQMPVLYG